MHRDSQPQSVHLLQSDTHFTYGQCVERDPCVASRTLGLWDLTFHLPRSRDFQLSRRFLAGEDFALYTDTYRVDTQITGSTPRDTFTLVIPLNTPGGSEGFGLAFNEQQVLAGFHSCVDVVFAPGQQILVVSLQRRLMLQLCTVGELDAMEAACRARWLTPARGKLALARRYLLELLTASPQHRTLPGRDLPSDVAGAVIELVGDCPTMAQTSGNAPLRRRGYERALRVIDACGQQLPSIPQLCTEAGVSQRTLEYAFRDYTGMTPKQFLQYSRYWQLRKALLTDDACRSVHEAASKLGIHEMGRMAAEYRRRFGELPSESLHRGNRQHRFSIRPIVSAASG